MVEVACSTKEMGLHLISYLALRKRKEKGGNSKNES